MHSGAGAPRAKEMVRMGDETSGGRCYCERTGGVVSPREIQLFDSSFNGLEQQISIPKGVETRCRTTPLPRSA
jgi:hypothetical protein